MASVESQPEPTQVQSGPVHELSSHWTLWTHVSANVNGKKKRALGPVFDFSSVEDFWVVYNSLQPPSKITGRHDIIFMRSQLNTELDQETNLTPLEREQQKFMRIQPEWEDPNNAGGGEFRFTLSSDLEVACKQWEVTLLAVLGGSMSHPDEVCGVWLGLGRKGGSTLSLWQRTPSESTDPDIVEQIAKGWAQVLDDADVPVTEMTYTSHKAALDSANNHYTSVAKQVWTAEQLLSQEDAL